MKQIMKGFDKLNRAQKIQVGILSFTLLFTGYIYWYAGVYGEINSNSNMISRAENRIKLRKSEALPAPKKSASEHELEKARKQLEEAEMALSRFSQRFVGDDESNLQQQLRHEISELATGLKMHVITFEDAAKRTGRDDDVPIFQEVNREYGRPLLKLHALSHYSAIQTFLDELGTLSYYVAPVHFKLIAEEPRIKAEQALQQKQMLRFEVILTM